VWGRGTFNLEAPISGRVHMEEQLHVDMGGFSEGGEGTAGREKKLTRRGHTKTIPMGMATSLIKYFSKGEIKTPAFEV